MMAFEHLLSGPLEEGELENMFMGMILHIFSFLLSFSLFLSTSFDK